MNESELDTVNHLPFCPIVGEDNVREYLSFQL